MNAFAYLLPATLLACALIAILLRHRQQQRMRTRTATILQYRERAPATRLAMLSRRNLQQKLGPEARISIGAGALSLLLAGWLHVPLWLSLALAIAVTWLTLSLVRRIRLQRARALFSADFPAAVDHLTRAIQSGVPMERALKSIGDSFSEELGKRFRRLAHELEIGISFRDAMQHLASDLNMPDVSFFCAALALNRDSGGTLAHILTMLSKTLHERQRVALRLKTLTAESRAAARIVGSLPLIIVGLQAWLNPRQFDFLLNDGIGQSILAIASVCIISGLTIIWRMARL